jgi:hypothetical protein
MKRSPFACFNCGSTTHGVSTCPTKGCNYCKELGHDKTKCPKLMHKNNISAPVNQHRSAPVNQHRSAPVNQHRSAPVNQHRSAPVNQPQSVPVNQPQSATVIQPRHEPVSQPRHEPVRQHRSAPVNQPQKIWKQFPENVILCTAYFLLENVPASFEDLAEEDLIKISEYLIKIGASSKDYYSTYHDEQLKKSLLIEKLEQERQEKLRIEKETRENKPYYVIQQHEQNKRLKKERKEAIRMSKLEEDKLKNGEARAKASKELKNKSDKAKEDELRSAAERFKQAKLKKSIFTDE